MTATEYFWSILTKSCLCKTYFVFIFCISFDQFNTSILLHIFPPDDTILVEHLRPSTTFLIRIRARNEVGVGNPYTLTVTMDDVSKPLYLILP